MKRRIFDADRASIFLAFVMLVAAAANFYQFAAIDAHVPRHHRAIYPFDSFDIVELGLKLTNIRDTLNLFAVIRRAAPGTPLVVTSPELKRRGNEFRARMLSIGAIGRIETCELDDGAVQLAPSMDLHKGEFWKYPSQARRKVLGRSWAFATAPSTPTRLVQLRTPDINFVIVDEALILGREEICR